MTLATTVYTIIYNILRKKHAIVAAAAEVEDPSTVVSLEDVPAKVSVNAASTCEKTLKSPG